MRHFSCFFVSILVVMGLIASCKKAAFLELTSPTTIAISNIGGAQSITFTTNRDWSVSSSESWCQITPSVGTAHDGLVSVTVLVEDNPTYDARSCSITIKSDELSQTLSVTQDAGYGLIISPTTFNLSNAAQNIEVEVKSNVKYSISTDANWITIPSTKSLTSEKVILSIGANETYDTRTAKVTFSQDNGDLRESLTVTQAEGYGLIIGAPSYSVSNQKQVLEVEVQANVDFTVSSSVSWIKYIETKALSKSVVQLSIEANEGYDAREGTVTIEQKDGPLSGTVKIVQEQKDAILLSPEGISLPYSGGESTVSVQSNVEMNAVVQDGADWVTITQDSQTKGLEQVTYTVKADKNVAERREADILFSGKGIEKKLHVIQESVLDLEQSTHTADCLDGATVTIQFSARDSWAIREKGSSFLTLSQDSGEAGPQSITVTLNGANCTNDDRFALLELECAGILRTIQIQQIPAFRFDSLEHVIPAAGGTIQFYFYFPRPYMTHGVNVKCNEYDTGFLDMLNRIVWENAPSELLLAGSDSSMATPASSNMYYAFTFQANCSSQTRQGRFRLSYEENGQVLFSEWVSITQAADEYMADELNGVVTVLQQHSKGTGVPIVILGDGFTKSDIADGTYAKVTGQAYEYFFSAEPVSSLREYFDVWSITAISDPNAVIGKGSTRFGSVLSSTPGDTYTYGNDAMAYHYAVKVVPQDKRNDMVVIIVLNTTRYAGTCWLYWQGTSGGRRMTYSIAYVTMAQEFGMSFENVIHHEACGHGLGKLADEYYSNAGTVPDSKVSDLLAFHSEGAYVNVDINSSLESVLWNTYAADERFSPEAIGVYEGGYTYSRGVYRPTQTSIMVTNKGVFNAPSRAQIYRRVISIANNWDWTFDYEDFVSFDAPFRASHYNSSATAQQARPQNYVEINDFIPLASPVWVEDKEGRE